MLSPEVFRLARNNVGWCRLLDLTGMTDTLIAGADASTIGRCSTTGSLRSSACIHGRSRQHRLVRDDGTLRSDTV